MANNSIQEAPLDHPPTLFDMIADNSIHKALLARPTVLTVKPSEGPIQLRRCMPTLDPHRNPTEHSSLIPPPPRPGKFRRVTFLLCVYLIVGVIIFYLVMDQMSGTRTNRVLDAIYLVIVTMTSVGCGDLVPNSDTTKLIACAFVFTGVAIVGTYLSKLADHMIEKQEVFFKATQSEANMLSLCDTSRIKYKLYTVSLLLGVDVVAGTVFLWKVEKMSLVDSFYCVFYGDKSFPSKLGRVFAIFWIITSTIIMAQFFEYLTDFYTERRQKAIAKWLLTRDLTTIDLERADLDGDRQVG
ncbi:hypothetical protein HU200_029499 [Digitaria exilis]|uniref:Potassium channel domain-containing protein n=1 Tax=Digitaria exilis TaxID=1010633 RepID=A0A835ERK4_9POAL|nr:hypothetical protein HU200_029499 [Digitaria exilis]